MPISELLFLLLSFSTSKKTFLDQPSTTQPKYISEKGSNRLLCLSSGESRRNHFHLHARITVFCLVQGPEVGKKFWTKHCLFPRYEISEPDKPRVVTKIYFFYVSWLFSYSSCLERQGLKGLFPAGRHCNDSPLRSAWPGFYRSNPISV